MARRIFIFMLLVHVYSMAAQGQEFVLEPPTVWDTTMGVEPYEPGDEYHNYVVMETKLTNVSDAGFKFVWRNITDTLANPEDWMLSGVCDNIVCRFERQPWFYGEPQTSETVEPGGSSPMIAHIYAPWDSTVGMGIYKLEVKTAEQTDTIVFILNKEKSVGMQLISVLDKRVFLYPNPATNYINIYCSKALQIHHVNIINILGRRESSKKLQTDRELNRIDMDNLVPGMYTINFIDINGNVVTNRKFVKR